MQRVHGADRTILKNRRTRREDRRRKIDDCRVLYVLEQTSLGLLVLLSRETSLTHTSVEGGNDFRNANDAQSQFRRLRTKRVDGLAAGLLDVSLANAELSKNVLTPALLENGGDRLAPWAVSRNPGRFHEGLSVRSDEAGEISAIGLP